MTMRWALEWSMCVESTWALWPLLMPNGGILDRRRSFRLSFARYNSLFWESGISSSSSSSSSSLLSSSLDVSPFLPPFRRLSFGRRFFFLGLRPRALTSRYH